MKVFKPLVIFLILAFSKTLFAQNTPLRIVSLAPNLTELVYYLGLGEQVVATSNQCDFPIQAKNKLKLGDYFGINLEKVLQVKPNIVIATEGNPRNVVDKIKKLGIKVIEYNPQKISQMPSDIEYLAKELGKEIEGKKLASEIKQEVVNLTRLPRQRGNFIFILQFNPIYSLTPNTWLGDLLALAGFQNLIADSKIPYPTLQTEIFLLRKPQLIFVDKLGFKLGENIEQKSEEYLGKIYRNNLSLPKIIVLPSDILVRAGPRIIEGMRFLQNLKI